MLKRFVITLLPAITALLIVTVSCAGYKPAGEENPMNNTIRPAIDLALPAVTETATFSMG